MIQYKYMILGFKSKSRTGYLAVSILSIFAIIVMRLFFLQVIEGADYRARAGKGQRKQFEIKSQRGLIYAMDGKKLTKMVLNEMSILSGSIRKKLLMQKK